MRSFFAFVCLFSAVLLPVRAQTGQQAQPEQAAGPQSAAKQENAFVIPVTAQNWSFKPEQGKLTVTLTLPDGIFAYEKATGPELAGDGGETAVKPDSAPAATGHAGGKVFAGTVQWVFRTEPRTFPCILEVNWQACSKNGECYLPGSAALAVFSSKADWTAGKYHVPALPGAENGEKDAEPELPSAAKGGWIALPNYRMLRSANGYLPPEEFADFLKGTESSEDLLRLAGRGFWMMMLLVLLGGLALNLTPCVLPLIPVNLAMIGAAEDSERTRASRLVRGLVYGAGIAVAYGLLGVIAVLTGSTFGFLASNWIFNAAAAVVFLLLALAMFGVFNFDLSRFGANFRVPASLHHAGIFLMGALSATLAGACVAPVLAAVLIEAAGLYADGNSCGLLLPFLLGLGMALPWPFAAAGMSLFPKPGAWMVRVKQTLGILILILAAYYGFLATALLRGEIKAKNAAVPDIGLEQIAAALRQGEKEKKPVLLFFGASWCKNCTAMEVKTLPDREVRAALEKVIVVKIMAEDPGNPVTKSLLDQFEVVGLPAFVLLQPASGE